MVREAAASLSGAERDHSGPQQPLSNNDLPAAFWDALPDDENADLQAINALKEESTPDDRAEALKNQGNDAFKRGLQLNKKFFVKEAIQKYTEAIGIKDWQDKSLHAALYSNRAQAHLRIENNRNALDDALEALRLEPDNDKATYRGASAAARMKDFEKSEQLLTDGLERTPGAPELEKLHREVVEKAKAAKKAREKEAARQLVLRAPSRKLASALLKRGWRIGAPQVSVEDKKPYLDEKGLVHWPLLFMYPEVMQSDVVQDATETDTLQIHLDIMFGAGAPPLQWDADRKYSRNNLEVYYFSHAAKPLPLDKLTEALYSGWPAEHEEEGPSMYGAKASKPIRLQEDKSFSEILSTDDFVVPGVPMFFILAKGSIFRDKFLESV